MFRVVSLVLAALVLWTSVLLPTPCGAQARDREARAHFEAARIAYEDGRFEDALAAFQRSYELSRRAELLYNMGQCADRLRRDADALRWFEQYLAEAPAPENRGEVEQRIRALRAATDDVSSDPVTAPDATAPPEEEPAAQRPLHEEWWLWTIVGVLVVGAAVGIGVGVSEASRTAQPVPGDVGPGGVITALRWELP